MTPSEIAALLDWELDNYITERVFDIPVREGRNGAYYHDELYSEGSPIEVHPYSTDPAAMMELLEKLRGDGWFVSIAGDFENWAVLVSRHDAAHQSIAPNIARLPRAVAEASAMSVKEKT